ncbi:hypothetical protein NLU13_3084 [Sarocladium strictum]|uniref:Serine/threonine-protein kinase ppk6 n=1 Tax=Sarocladium strictum TaxID=5046 RepID=A0AA39LA39_SARSR|nr:hypothetical protein NLU13_3084 [Sarocladium strictum]
MSADLFAEFNELSKSPPQSRSQPAFGQPPAQPQPQTQTSGTSHDLFSFVQGTNTNAVSHQQPSQQWGSFAAQPSSSVAWGGNGSSVLPQTAGAGAGDDDDDWGEFETSESKPVATVTQPQQSWNPSGPQSSIQWQHPAPLTDSPRPGVVRASTMDLMTNSLVSTGDQARPPPAPSIREEWPSSPPKARPKLSKGSSDPNVLFDAGDFELEGGDDLDDGLDDDDFGDFETVAPVPSQPAGQRRPAVKSVPPSLDLLGLSLDDGPSPATTAQSKSIFLQTQSSGLPSFGAAAGGYPIAPKSPSFQQRNPFPALAINTPVKTEFDKKDANKSASPVTAWPSFEKEEAQGTGKYQDDDGWGAWDDIPSGPSQVTGDTGSTKAPENWKWDSVGNVQPIASSVKGDDSAPPPVNVPPPSVILSIFPDLLNSAKQLFKPMAGQSASIKERILSDPKAVGFLQAYILLATTAAHVIAGRKQRWHRDKILAKSMSISAAGSKGMKLAGVDKTQSAREDREAADVVAVWRDNVGRVRSAVAAANSAGKANLKVPELAEAMQVQTAKSALTAPKSCVICGLKREERVNKVDFEVEDSFGEWWVDHWGHRACKNFWLEHEQMLRQR